MVSPACMSVRYGGDAAIGKFIPCRGRASQEPIPRLPP
jgi:hypothetical protein